MRKSNVLSVALCMALVARAAVEWRPSAIEISSWNNVMPPGETSGNAVFSPVGFGMAVAILGEGIGGAARAEMAESLGLISDFSVPFAQVLKSYAAANASNRVSITVATSLWSSRKRALSADYILTLQRNFEAEAGSLKTILPINAWNEAKTEGRIPDIVKEMPQKTETLLLNAVAFEGAWKKPFDDDKGGLVEFTRLDGTKAKLRLMRTVCPVVRVDRGRYVAAKVDFAARGMSFVVVLPAEDVKLSELREKDLTSDGVDELKALLRARSGDGVSYALSQVALPSFTIRSDWRLDAALRAAKVPRTGFDRMGEGVFTVDDVRQAAYISITGKGYSLTPGMEPEPPNPRKRKGRGELARGAEDDDEASLARRAPGAPFVCDRPFVFFLWDGLTDTLALAGQFAGPEIETKQPKGDKRP